MMMTTSDLRHLALAPELAQLESTRAVLLILLRVLEQRHPALEDTQPLYEPRTLMPARHVARRARALLVAIRRYAAQVDESRLDHLRFEPIHHRKSGF